MRMRDTLPRGGDITVPTGLFIFLAKAQSEISDLGEGY